MKQYDTILGGSGGELTIEERMLEAMQKLAESKGSGAITFNFRSAAKSCASIAQEEIDKAVKERCIEFGDLIKKSGFRCVGSYWYKYSADPHTTEQLFDLFNKK